jgi:hypothetical protein
VIVWKVWATSESRLENSGTVEQANEDDAVVKWDDDGRMKDSPTAPQEGLTREGLTRTRLGLFAVVCVCCFRLLEKRKVDFRPHPQIFVRLRKQRPYGHRSSIDQRLRIYQFTARYGALLSRARQPHSSEKV